MMATLTRVNCCSALLIKDSQIILAPGHRKKGAIWPRSSDLGFSLLLYLPSIHMDENKFAFPLTKASVDVQVKIEKCVRGSLKMSQFGDH